MHSAVVIYEWIEWDLDNKPLWLEVGISPLHKSIFIIFRQWRKEFNHLFINSNSRRKKACFWISISCFCFVENCFFISCLWLGNSAKHFILTIGSLICISVIASNLEFLESSGISLIDLIHWCIYSLLRILAPTWLVILVPAPTLSSIMGDIDVRIFQFCNFLNSNDLHLHQTSMMHFYDNTKNLNLSHH